MEQLVGLDHELLGLTPALLTLLGGHQFTQSPRELIGQVLTVVHTDECNAGPYRPGLEHDGEY